MGPRMAGQVNIPARVQPRTQEQRTEQSSRRTSRAYNPISSQGRTQGRARGSPNYRPREVETLLDLVEAELPVGSKGWNVVGARFREWATTTEYPSRTDRSLEVKFKQVCTIRLPHASGFDDHPHSLYEPKSQPGMVNALPRLNAHMKSTARSRQRSRAVILRMTRSPNSGTTTTSCPSTTRTMVTKLFLLLSSRSQPSVFEPCERNLLHPANPPQGALTSWTK